MSGTSTGALETVLQPVENETTLVASLAVLHSPGAVRLAARDAGCPLGPAIYVDGLFVFAAIAVLPGHVRVGVTGAGVP